ncbi:hypothetical protein B0T14DRAFT_425714 [Immersiella caudata]|uniref:Uncharacterized protein n=1 Tax=Immersiella caudata TaxID=314043 RepID=A0AA40C4U8_9PEZI|nr:hypothetical protein B0T14DRAFT_425714 [Immersiella caudata]
MATVSNVGVRYSHSAVALSPTARQFRWETPVPTTPFWDSLPWVLCSQFLSNFTPTELSALPIDSSNSASLTTKQRTEFLLKLLQDKLTTSGMSITSPGAGANLLHAIHYLQKELGLVKEAGETIRLLLSADGGKDNIAAQQSYAHQLIDEGSFVEAEKVIRPACEDIDEYGNLGRDSPQGIGSQRTLLKALWGQGKERREEAAEVVEGIRGRIEGMKGGKFEVYVEAEREELERLLGKLGA